MTMSPVFAFFEGAFAPSHIILVLIIGFLLFGKRLPEMGRSLGKGLQEFKKGINGVEDDLQTSTQRVEAPPEPLRPPQRVTAAAPKFDGTSPAGPTPPKA
jgi:sec-independent protein translocase protein TatA